MTGNMPIPNSQINPNTLHIPKMQAKSVVDQTIVPKDYDGPSYNLYIIQTTHTHNSHYELYFPNELTMSKTCEVLKALAPDIILKKFGITENVEEQEKTIDYDLDWTGEFYNIYLHTKNDYIMFKFAGPDVKQFLQSIKNIHSINLSYVKIKQEFKIKKWVEI